MLLTAMLGFAFTYFAKTSTKVVSPMCPFVCFAENYDYYQDEVLPPVSKKMSDYTKSIYIYEIAQGG